MPTWAATKSLLQSGQRVNHTNSDVVVPLFKSSPTDYATLYSVLTLTQEISAVVVGPERRTKIQQSVGRNRWVLRARELHLCFAALHGLGKYLEGSRLDTVAVETGIYSPAALRGIYTGKAFKRGVEYNLKNVLACSFLKFGAVLGEMPPDAPLQKQCEELKSSLHQRSDNVTDIYDDFSAYCTSSVHAVRATGRRIWQHWMIRSSTSIYAHDLFHYARLMPVHLAQMNQLECDDPITWNALKEGNLCVKNTDSPFTALFADQALEQKIKELKGVGHLVGITQDEVSLDRVIITLPQITSIVNDWLCRFPRFSTASHSSCQHYQLSGDIAPRSRRNALKLRDSIQLHCEGNPFIVGTPLKSIVSSVLIPEAAKEDILHQDEEGLGGYRKFVKERLVPDASLSVWSTMNNMKLKAFSTWMAKTLVSVGDQVIKLREERQLLARFLVIQQSRPELVPRLPATIGNYEMLVTPRSMFVSDGSLLIPTDKASIIHAVEEANPIRTETETPTEAIVQAPRTQTPVQAPRQDDTHDGLLNILGDDSVESVQPHDHVIIIDSMAVVQCMKNGPGMKKIINFEDAFVKRITRMVKPYDEGRIICDRYDIAQSLKQKTRAKRAQGKEMEFAIHDEMDIAKITLKELLSASKTKALLSNILGNALLEE